MAKNNRQDLIAESLVLRFLTAPVKLLKIILLVIAILFGSSILLQSYFYRPDLLQQEVENTMQLGNQSLWQKWTTNDGRLPENKNPDTGINLTLTRYTYTALSTVLYEWIPLNYLLESNPGDTGYGIKEQFLEPNRDYLERFDQVIRVISLRLGNIAFLSIFAIYLSLLAVIDGFVQRCIRQENASRESAGIYHRAKYWRTGIVSTSSVLYLSTPWPLSPLWLLLPICIGAAMVYLQAKYLKKYL
ncbi:DUF4400 domain-containing protein [Eikenella corrodens]|uniref:DUF4400 domain-containing protein n=1 Tax=Eikenella corrodens TaxID=539 RepID=UPI000664FB40|nr:DUF4400 domain-containing protein [Eikenella corrodens]